MKRTKSPMEIVESLGDGRKPLSEKSIRVNYDLSDTAIDALSWITSARQDLSIKKIVEYVVFGSSGFIIYSLKNGLALDCIGPGFLGQFSV